jgi:hypothetical protein
MDAFLRCQLSLGMFQGEYAVRGKTAEETEFSLFVPEEFVECDSPVSDGAIDGWLRVNVLAQANHLMLVRLPGQAFENGRTVTVRESEIERRSSHEPA